ncbi:MAG: porin [Sphingobium sp.]
MKRSVGIYLFSSIGASIASPAFAQVDVPPDGLTVTPTVRLMYDSNVLRQNQNNYPGDLDGTRITPSIDATFRRQFGLHQVTVVGTLGYDFYSKQDFLNRERIAVAANADIKATGYCHVKPNGTLDFSQSNLADQGEIVGNTQRTQNYRVTFDCDKPYSFYPVVTVGYLFTQNSSNRRRVFDVNTFEVSGGIGYNKPSLGDIQLTASYERYRRPNVDEVIPGLRDGAENYAFGARFSRAVAPRLSWHIGANYFTTKPRALTLARFKGVGLSGGFNFHPSPNLSIVGDGSRSSRNQGSTGATFIIETRYSLRANAKIGARSTLTGGASISNRQFKGELLLDTNVRRIADTTTTLNIGYRYTLRDRLQIGTELRHEWRTSKAAVYEYKDTTAMLLLGVQL